MLVRMITVARGEAFNADPGELKEVTDEFGAELIAGGYAEPAADLWSPPAGDDAPAGATAAEGRETAVAPRRRTKR